MTAVSKQEYYDKWGQHFLPSLANSHSLQICNNFKDPGVQVYGGPMFQELRDMADDIFCDLPPPTPSRRRVAAPTAYQPTAPMFSGAYGGGGHQGHSAPPPQIDMSRYHNRSAGCFGGDCLVAMAAAAASAKRVRDIRRGDKVMTAGGGAATVLCVVKTACGVGGVTEMVQLPGGLAITPYHPVRVGGRWAFPKDLGVPAEVAADAVYTYVLESGHTVLIDGVECVTLGHGFNDDVVRHPFFGSQQVVDDLRAFPGWAAGIVTLQQGSFRRSTATGMIAAIRKPSPQAVTPVAAEIAGALLPARGLLNASC